MAPEPSKMRLTVACASLRKLFPASAGKVGGMPSPVGLWQLAQSDV
jgi:hypothetical protein